MLRVFFTGAFHPPRRVNWQIGLALFLGILISNFTGYLLPWDQLAFWAITIVTSMFDYVPYVGQKIQFFILGGFEVGPATLSTFFAIHIAIMPCILGILLPFHFWKVRKAGGVAVPPPTQKTENSKSNYLPANPNLIVKEIAVALIVVAAVLIFATFFNASLDNPANPGLSPNPTKAPWYFMGIQELLFHFHPVIAAFFLPILMLFWLILLPFIPYKDVKPGVWFISSNGKKMGKISTAIACIIVPLLIIYSEFFSGSENGSSLIPPFIKEGILPCALILTFFFTYYIWIKRRFNATRGEAIQALCIFLIITFSILTITGIFFRGHGMALYWPWNLAQAIH